MLTFCITCKGRSNHIKETLPKNLADNTDPNHKFILLDYNSQDDLIDYLKSNHQKDIDSGRLIVYSFKGSGPFRMAHAKNMAHRLGILEGGDILVNLDADNFTGKEFSTYIQDKFREDNIFLWAKRIVGQAHTRGTSGRIIVSAKSFILTGGYDEKYTTWSPDDKDFNARLCRLGFISREIDPKFLKAKVHNDNVRFSEYQHIDPDESEEESLKIKESDNTIANFGKIGCGMVYKNFSNDPINIDPIPTRIFGIGMHKTATTSLNKAFKILGYHSAHWKSPQWARNIWEEINKFGKSRTLENYYAICDLPITLLYQSLDIAYPGSKFILTIRNERDWLESVKNHWDKDLNIFRDSWDNDAFTNKVHQELYGRKKFDAEIFIKRFRKHNDEVRNYFKNRPQDLLILDVDKKEKWEQLCPFLNREIPNVSYPAEFNTDKRVIFVAENI